MSADLASVLTGHRAVVCVGTGGVGKTTTAAALGLAAARLGRRTMVLTIDPARQLARALGLESLSLTGEPVDTGGFAAPGLLHAGMLDLKGAWDAFITRHAKSDAARAALFGNPFYQKLSTSFAGSTEYMAIEELCRLDESRAFDLIIIDTPPSAHAIDFLRAPERLEQLLSPEVSRWILGRKRGAALRAMSGLVTGAVDFFVHRLESALGTRTLGEVSAFFIALDALFGDLSARAARGRALLYGKDTAFVMVVAPTERELAGARELGEALAALGVPLRAAVANRVHPFPGSDTLTTGDLERTLGEVATSPEVRAWLEETWSAALTVARAERRRLEAFAATLPPDTAWVEVPELQRDAHSLADLLELASRLVDPAPKTSFGADAGPGDP